MRSSFHDELETITAKLEQMAILANSMVGRATTALLEADHNLAEQVISGDDEMDALYHDVERLAYDLFARQQPVAGDLRLVVTGLRMMADLERMGDLAMHIAQAARRRYPASAVPPELRSLVLEMGQTSQRIVAKAASVIANRDVAAALELEADDDVMDSYQRRLFTLLLGEPSPRFPVEVAVDTVLLGRYYERFCDHAVSVARRVVFLVTGKTAEEVAGEGGSL